MYTCLHSHFVVNSYISRYKAELFLELPHNFKVRSAVEGIPSSVQQFQQVIGDMPTCQLQPFKTCGDNVSVKDWNAVSDTISTIEQHGGHHSLSEQRHESLRPVLYFIDLELLEK